MGKITKRFYSAGFSLVEVLATIAVIGVITGVVVQVTRIEIATVEEAKMEGDVRRLNSAIEIYKSFGGRVDDAATPQEVLRRLKTEADAVSRESVAGLTGSLIDRRIVIELLNESDIGSSKPRALWIPAQEKFVIANSGSSTQVNVARFALSAAAAAEAVETESRSGVMDLAITDSWIWDYDDSGLGGIFDPIPTWAPTTVGGNPVSGPGPAPGAGPPGTPAPLAPPNSLNSPIFSHPGGTYSAADFDLIVSLSDPNPPHLSRLMYQVDNGPEILYSGPITVRPGEQVVAYVLSSDPAAWSNSGDVINTYEADAIFLGVPFITLSAAAFDFGPNQSVLVSMTHSNDPSYSKIIYRLDGGPWQDYMAPLGLSVFMYAAHVGADIEARAVSANPAEADYYLNSAIVSARVDPAPVPLSPPEIAFSEPAFSGAIYNGELHTAAGLSGGAPVVAGATGASDLVAKFIWEAGKGDEWNHGDQLIAKLEWDDNNAVWEEKGGTNPGAVTVNNMVFFDADKKDLVSAGFSSTVAIDSVEVENDGDTINFFGGVTSGTGLVRAGGAKYAKLMFYYNGPIDTGVFTDDGGSDTAAITISDIAYLGGDPDRPHSARWSSTTPIDGLVVKSADDTLVDTVVFDTPATSGSFYAVKNEAISSVQFITGAIVDDDIVSNKDWNSDDRLVAEYEWKGDDGWKYNKGQSGDVFGFANEVFYNSDGKELTSVDFTVDTLIDSVIVEKEVDTFYYDPAVQSGSLSRSGNEKFKKIMFYYNGTPPPSNNNGNGNGGNTELPTVGGNGEPDEAVETISVTLNDLANSAGTSKLRYKVVPRDEDHDGYTILPPGEETSDFVLYTGAFDVAAADFPEGFGVMTFAEAATTEFNDSALVYNHVGATPSLTISGNAYGSFHDPVGGGGLVSNLEGGGTSDYVSWGRPTGGTEDPSWLRFTGASVGNASDGERFLLGTVDFYNGTIASGTGATSVGLALTLEFDGSEERTFEFTLEMVNRANNSGTQAGDADLVRFSSLTSSTTTTIYDWDFDLSLEFGESTVNGFTTISEFNVFEDAMARGSLYGTLRKK